MSIFNPCFRRPEAIIIWSTPCTLNWVRLALRLAGIEYINRHLQAEMLNSTLFGLNSESNYNSLLCNSFSCQIKTHNARSRRFAYGLLRLSRRSSGFHQHLQCPARQCDQLGFIRRLFRYLKRNGHFSLLPRNSSFGPLLRKSC